MLQIKNVHAGYNKIEIVKGVDLYIKEKEIVALIGPNGAGKSTILRSIFNIASVSKGEIILHGENIVGLAPYELISKGVSYINQGKVVFQTLSVKENLEIGIENKKEKELLLEEVFKEFPILKEREHALAYELSGGQQQMLAIGRTLMRTPKLLLLDEPSLGLSPKLQKEVFEIIKNLKKRDVSILIVEQNAKRAIEIADRTYVLEDGKIALEGSGDFMLRHKKIKEIYLGGRYGP